MHWRGCKCHEGKSAGTMYIIKKGKKVYVPKKERAKLKAGGTKAGGMKAGHKKACSCKKNKKGGGTKVGGGMRY